LLHHFQNALAGIGAILRIAIDRDRFLQRANVLLAMDIDASTALLCDRPDGAALAANDGPHHLALHKDAQREVRLASGTGHSRIRIALVALAAPLVLVQLLGMQLAALELDTVQTTSSSVWEREWL